MNSPLVDRLLKAVDIEGNLLPYLTFAGWEPADVDNPRWVVLHGEPDQADRPLELVFPREKGKEERQQYVTKAIELLASLKSEPVQLLLQSVINYDRDTLYVRNTETDKEDAIALNLAVDQVRHLKKTIEFSACSEREAKPYFVNPLRGAQAVTRNFLFGHTFAGSFGFTVESPRLSAPQEFIQQPLFKGDDTSPAPVNIPLERRMVERIVRGLLYTKQAEDQRDHSVLLREYTSGFNSNMCSAIVSMSEDKKAKVEFRVAWSPKIKPGEDVALAPAIQLRRDGYEALEYAAKKLKALKPESINLVGHVRALTVSDNPLSLGTHRAVVVKGNLPGVKRAVDVIVELDREDYAKANKAHIEWQIVQISGILNRSGVTWRLTDAKDLKVIA